jgi:haloacetate dehalogenase
VFDGFALERVDLGEVSVRVRHGGDGPPVVLLHGHPRTHTTWHAVASVLAEHFRVVAPDLRGYGESSLPPDLPDHVQSSKRAMAHDVIELMRRLGHGSFAVVGHDRGSLVAFRLAMDFPGIVTKLVVMDGLPVLEHLERTDARFAQAWWHWWFLGQTEKPAERLINLAPDQWYSTPSPEEMGPENHADVWAAFNRPAAVHGMAEDYRAGLAVDAIHEAQDRDAGRQIQCPTMLLESTQDDLDIQGNPAEIWAPWLARHLDHRLIDSGHHQAEQAPHAVAAALLAFLGSTSTSR